MGSIRMLRIYENIEVEGVRLLVDRLWPRGVTKEKAAIEYWPKELTPSADLRKAYHEGALSFESFQSSYWNELLEQSPSEELLETLRTVLKERDLILVTSVKDIERSHVPILKEFLEKKLIGKI